jgi:hypothetical protein
LQKSTVWEAILSLTKQEEKAFQKFLASPYYNQRAELNRLFAHFLTCKNDDVALAAPAIWEAVYPQHALNDQKLRLLFSDLLKLVEAFFIEIEQQKKPTEKETHLTKAYLQRGLTKQFLRTHKSAIEKNEEQAYRHADYYQSALHLAWLQYQHDAAVSRTGDFNLQALSELTDQGYFLHKLRLACLQLSHQKVFKTEYAFGALPFVLEYVERHQLTQIPAIGLYYDCYQFLTNTDAEQHFQAFQERLSKDAALFPPDELRTLYLLAINYAIKKVNELRADWFGPTLRLYQDALSRNLLLEHGVLSRFAFNNIVAIGLRTGETGWTTQFIHQYASFLEKKHRQAIIHFNQARIAYAQRDYDQVLTLLQQADYKDILNNLIAKTLLLKVYYETKSYASLESHLASMRIFIQRHKQLGYHQVNYLKLIKFTQLMVQMESTGKPTKQEFVAMVENEEGLVEREWLLFNYELRNTH